MKDMSLCGLMRRDLCYGLCAIVKLMCVFVSTLPLSLEYHWSYPSYGRDSLPSHQTCFFFLLDTQLNPGSSLPHHQMCPP